MSRDRHGRALRTDGDRRRRPTDGYRAHDVRRFLALAEEAIAALPEHLAAPLADADVAVHDVPDAPTAAQSGDAVALAHFDPGARPPELALYRRALERRALDRADLVALIRSAAGRAVGDALDLGTDGFG